MSKFIKSISVMLTALVLLVPGSLSAAVTTPDYVIYEGKLLYKDNSPITTAHTLRFSLWSSTDWITTDTNANGSLNTLAATYSGWSEVQTITPNQNGVFSVKLGAINPLTDINFDIHKYLQTEVRTPTQTDTDYQMLDTSGDNGTDTEDRQTIGSAPYSKNADKIDNREIGTSENSLALLGPNNQWLPSQIPSGTTNDTFVLDTDDSSTTNTKLQFGTTLDKYLLYNIPANRFEFNDNVYIDGDLTVTGTIYLDVLDLPERSKTETVIPAYPGTTVLEDGSNNQATLKLDHDTVANKQYYTLTSNQGTLQDLDLLVQIPLPSDFKSWATTNALAIDLQTDTNLSTDNKLDLSLNDTTSTTTLSATNLLSSTSGLWQTHSFDITSGTWNANENLTLQLKLSSQNLKAVHLGDIHLNYIAQ